MQIEVIEEEILEIVLGNGVWRRRLMHLIHLCYIIGAILLNVFVNRLQNCFPLVHILRMVRCPLSLEIGALGLVVRN